MPWEQPWGYSPQCSPCWGHPAPLCFGGIKGPGRRDRGPGGPSGSAEWWGASSAPSSAGPSWFRRAWGYVTVRPLTPPALADAEQAGCPSILSAASSPSIRQSPGEEEDNALPTRSHLFQQPPGFTFAKTPPVRATARQLPLRSAAQPPRLTPRCQIVSDV